MARFWPLAILLVTAAEAAPAPAAQPPSLLELFERADLNTVTLTAVDDLSFPACLVDDKPTWIISALDVSNDGATCIGNGSSPPSCVMFAGTTPEHVAKVMCKDRANARTATAPTWASAVLAAMPAISRGAFVEVKPVSTAPRPALAITIDERLFVAIRTDAGWRGTQEPVDSMMKLAVHRVLDTTELTGTPSFGAITSSYSGGSESGSEFRTLTVLEPTATRLDIVAATVVGQFTWILDARERKRYPRAAFDLEARPHVEVRLAPRLEPGVLVLEVERAKLSKELRGTCKTVEEDELDPPCILRTMKALAGRYRLVNDELRRIP